MHRSDIETLILCPEETCLPNSATQLYFRYTDDNRDQSNDYVQFDDENNDFDEHAPKDSAGDCSAGIDPYDAELASTEAYKMQSKLKSYNFEVPNDFREYCYDKMGTRCSEAAEMNDADSKTEDNNENNENVGHEGLCAFNKEIFEETGRIKLIVEITNFK